MVTIKDKNISPVGWYVGSYLLRFVAVEESYKNENFEPEERFITWENTVIVKAESMDEAYHRIENIGKKDNTEPYTSAEGGGLVQWFYEGITELLPIYEELEDGAEIMWQERHPRKLKNIQDLTLTLDELKNWGSTS